MLYPLPNLPEMMNNIENHSYQRLKQLFPAGIPDFAMERYHEELLLIKKSEKTQFQFEMHRLMTKEAEHAGLILMLQGTAAGSLIAYLLGEFLFNPLPSYYYCPECGHYELSRSVSFGIDFPIRRCPSCNKDMVSDGCRIPIKSVWGSKLNRDITLEYSCPSELHPYIRRLLQKLFPSHEVIIYGKPELVSDQASPRISHCGYVILPEKCLFEDYPEFQSYLDSGEECFIASERELDNCGIVRVAAGNDAQLDLLVAMQRVTGFYLRDISYTDLRNMTYAKIANTGILSDNITRLLRKIAPKNYYELSGVIGRCHCSTAVPSLELADLMKRKEYQSYPCYTREDLYEAFLNIGISEEASFQLSELVRTGNAARNNGNRWVRAIEDKSLPDNLRQVCEQYYYVSSRSNVVTMILFYALHGFYLQLDSRAYKKVLGNKKDTL